MTAAGLSGAAALERVQALDRLAGVRLARQPVDGVGGEHGDAADPDAAGERLGVGGLQRHRRPTTTRSIPARSATASVSPKPAARTISATAPAWPEPTSSASSAAPVAAAAGARRRISDEAVRARVERQRRLVARDVGRERAAVGVGHVGRVGEHGVQPAGDRLEQVALAAAPPRARAAARWRARRRAPPGWRRWRSPRGRAARPSAPAPRRPSRCRRRPRARRAAGRAPPRRDARSPGAGSARAGRRAGRSCGSPCVPRM